MGNSPRQLNQNDIQSNNSSSAIVTAPPTGISFQTSSSDIPLTTVLVPNGVPPNAYSCDGNGTIVTYCTDNRNSNDPVAIVTFVPSQGQYTAVIPVDSYRSSPISTSATSITSTSDNNAVTPSTQSTLFSFSSSSAAAAATSSIQPALESSHSDRGAVAAAAVGCFLAGIALAGLIAFFIFRKQKNERYTRPPRYAHTPSHSYGGEKGTPMVTISPATPDFLPQQADDTEIRRRISTVIDQIDQHVENFYINHAIQTKPQMEGELSRFETSQLPQLLPVCFNWSSQPTVLIKHCLAFHTFNLTMAPSEGTTPVLPAELVSMIGATYSKSIDPQISKDFITAFSSWKRLTAYLRPELLRDPRILTKSAEATRRIATHFSAVFSPWHNDAYSDEQRTGHLAELLDHAVYTAIWLFSQPDSFRFDWTAGGTGASEAPETGIGRSISIRGRGAERAVVAPGVSKVTYAGARLPGAGQPILAPVVKRIW